MRSGWDRLDALERSWRRRKLIAPDETFDLWPDLVAYLLGWELR